MSIKVSFIIVALNEEATIGKLLECLKRQTYPHKLIEIIMIDGLSTDKTKAEMLSFQQNEKSFWQIKVLDNPKRTLPCGWNIALVNAQGDALLRVDAHVLIPDSFIEQNVKNLLRGENISGGKVTSVPADDTKWSVVLNEAENSMFGGSFASFRRARTAGYAKTAAFALYQKQVFDKVGRYNEALARTEDNEMHYRMRRAGYRFYYDPKIVTFRKTRSSFKELAKQKYFNGYWIGRTLWIEPRCFSFYHFVPLVFLLSILACLTLCFFGKYWPAVALLGIYVLMSFAMTMASVARCRKRNLLFTFLPLIFFTLHMSYGIGTLVGFFTAKNFRY